MDPTYTTAPYTTPPYIAPVLATPPYTTPPYTTPPYIAPVLTTTPVLAAAPVFTTTPVLAAAPVDTLSVFDQISQEAETEYVPPEDSADPYSYGASTDPNSYADYSEIMTKVVEQIAKLSSAPTVINSGGTSIGGAQDSKSYDSGPESKTDNECTHNGIECAKYDKTKHIKSESVESTTPWWVWLVVIGFFICIGFIGYKRWQAGKAAEARAAEARKAAKAPPAK